MAAEETQFVDLYERYHRQIAAYCGRRTRPDQVDDAVSDTFLVAWRRIDDVPHGESALPWLYGVAHKVLSHQWRSRFRRKRLNSKLKSMGVAPVVKPEEVVVQRSESRRALKALERLGTTDQEILRMAAWEGLTHDEIAVALGIRPGAVRQRFYQAKKNLTRQYNRLEKKRNSSPAAQKGGVS